MAVTCLLDTSVITRLSIGAVRAKVERLVADHDEVGRASISDLEVGFSARNAAEFDSIVGSLDAFELVEIEPRHFSRALQVQRLLADRGLRGRKVPDLLIAAAAESHTMTVIHYDGDFEHISSITGQRASWVVPAGTID
ncbi:MAG: PIN domain-containing protein [Acidimicrobiia bacterium]|nr:PIN domain-containing protein [Acidimicrobiia bacterium]